MSRPIAVAIEHHSSKEEMMRKLRDNFGQVRSQIAPYVSSVGEQWRENGVELRVSALAQTVTGTIAVDDRYVHIEVLLPGLLGFLSPYIADRLREGGTALLRKM